MKVSCLFRCDGGGGVLHYVTIYITILRYGCIAVYYMYRHLLTNIIIIIIIQHDDNNMLNYLR